MTLETILDQAQTFLHDDGTLWPRTELLRSANDGYRQLLKLSQAVVRPYCMDVPGRTAWSAAHEWEDAHAKGTFRRFSTPIKTIRRAGTFRWEAEHVEGSTPSASNDCVTHLWERAYSDEVDHHFRFAMSRAHDRPRRVYWDDKRLAPLTTRELDLTDTSWWTESGEPFYMLPGVGRDRTIELFEVQTTYSQAWDLRNLEAGIARALSSDAGRTYQTGVEASYQWDFAYTDTGDVGAMLGLGFRITITQALGVYATYQHEVDTINAVAADSVDDSADDVQTAWWELDILRIGVGLLRGAASDDRQYLALAYDSGDALLGSLRRVASSESSVCVWEVVMPTRNLSEGDVPGLIPTWFHKYLKYFVLSQAFMRVGEGHRPDLAQHFAALFQLGVGQLTMLGTPSLFDRVHVREQVKEASIKAPPRVRLPSTFQRVW